MYIAYLVLLFLAITSNTVLIYLLYNRFQKSHPIIFLILLIILIIIWITPKFITNALHLQGDLFEVMSRLSAFGYVFFPVSHLLFALVYTRSSFFLYQFRNWLLLLLPPFFFLFLSWTTNLVGVHDPQTAQLFSWGFETPTGPLYPVYLAWGMILMISGSLLVYRYYRALPFGLKKTQAKYVTLSLTIPLLIGVFTNGILPILGIFIFPTGIIMGNLMVIILVFAIARFGLFVITPEEVLSSLKHGIITVDHNMNTVQVNSVASKLLGILPTKVIGKPLPHFLNVQIQDKKQPNQIVKLVRQVLQHGRSKSFDSYFVLNHQRREHAYKISITPIVTANQVMGANIFIRDTTSEMDQAQQKDDIISLLSHELKTPLTSIKMYNQLLFKELDSDDRKKQHLVSSMDRQLDRINRLIRDFIGISQLEIGKLTVKRDFFGIGDFVLSCADTISTAYANRSIKIKGHTNLVVSADKDKIEQVMINLLTNAIKYSPKHKAVEILIDNDTDNVIIGIRDYGIGIPSRYHRKIFERNFQLNNKHRDKDSLGIGLYIASVMIKAHQGKMWVDSSPGKGSVFYFSLPIAYKD
jgi:PAS domain S-box-containing protein